MPINPITMHIDMRGEFASALVGIVQSMDTKAVELETSMMDASAIMAENVVSHLYVVLHVMYESEPWLSIRYRDDADTYWHLHVEIDPAEADQFMAAQPQARVQTNQHAHNIVLTDAEFTLMMEKEITRNGT